MYLKKSLVKIVTFSFQRLDSNCGESFKGGKIYGTTSTKQFGLENFLEMFFR